MCDKNENETLACTETEFRCAIFGAWLLYFISQFTLQKRGVARKNSIHKCSNNAVYIPLSFVDTQRGTFLINLSSRQYESPVLPRHNLSFLQYLQFM
jgi:hypothetical protein